MVQDQEAVSDTVIEMWGKPLPLDITREMLISAIEELPLGKWSGKDADVLARTLFRIFYKF